MTSIPDITLNNGQTIPQFGFGVFQIEPKDTVAAVSTALEAGYRHIDTAEMYGNEAEVGEAIASSRLDRGEVFVTSKLSNDAHEPDEARQAFEETLKALGTEYVDLFLIHWPLPTRYGGDFVQTWRTLEEFYREGRARSVGVSNFQPSHLRRLHGESQIIPAVNQIEVHPYLTQDDVRAFCVEHQIAVEAWSPLGQGSVLDDPVIRSIAERTGKTRGSGRTALAHPAGRHRVPQVGHPGPDPGEHRHLRLRAGRRRRRGHYGAGQERAHRPRSRQVRRPVAPRLTRSGWPRSRPPGRRRAYGSCHVRPGGPARRTEPS